MLCQGLTYRCSRYKNGLSIKKTNKIFYLKKYAGVYIAEFYTLGPSVFGGSPLRISDNTVLHASSVMNFLLCIPIFSYVTSYSFQL